MKGKAPIVVIVFTLIIAAFMVLVSLLPKTVELQASHRFSNSKEDIIAFLGTSENWKDWLFYVPKYELEYIQNGPEQGKGAGFKWFSKSEGDGVVEITEILENSLRYDLVTDGGLFRDRGIFLLQEEGSVTKVTWQDTLDVSTSVFARWAASNDDFAARLNKENLATLMKIDSLLNR